MYRVMANETSEEILMRALEELIDTRRDFFSTDFIRSFPYQNREAIVSRYFVSEHRLSDLLGRFYNLNAITTGAATLLSFSATPALNETFNEPVLVTPSPQQINTSLRALTTYSTNGNCAICQEVITTEGVQIRQCHHNYHRECIMSWFQRNVRCPVCRHDIREAGRSDQTSPASSQTSSQLPSQLEEH